MIYVLKKPKARLVVRTVNQVYAGDFIDFFSCTPGALSVTIMWRQIAFERDW